MEAREEVAAVSATPLLPDDADGRHCRSDHRRAKPHRSNDTAGGIFLFAACGFSVEAIIFCSETNKFSINMGNVQNLIPYQFKPGQSGNPKGRPKNRVPAQLVTIFGSKAKAKKFYALTGEEIDDWEEAVLSMTTEDLKELVRWPDAPAYPKGLAAAVLTEMKDGKTGTLDKLRDRVMKRAASKPVAVSSEAASSVLQGISPEKQLLIEAKSEYIIKTLKASGKYTEELSLQVRQVAQLLVRTDELAAEVLSSGHQAVNVEISREGNERETVSPKERLYLDYAQRSQRALQSLGMNMDAKERKTESDSLKDFLAEFKSEEEGEE